jgi:TPR repeat protein
MTGQNKYSALLSAGLVATLLTASPAKAVEGSSAEFKRGMSAYNSGAFVQAANIWGRLSANGSAIAQSSLGLLYYTGSGVPVDLARARKLFVAAAKANVPQAQMFLSLMYRRGEGVRQSYIMSYMWCDIAVGAGHEAASYVRETIGEFMNGDEVLQAQRLASEWRQHNLP